MTTKSTGGPLAHFVAVPNKGMFPKGEETKGGSIMWIIPPVAGLIEPVVAPEIYVENIGAVQFTGHSLRIAYYAREMSVHGGDGDPVIKLWLRRPTCQSALILSHVQRINEFFADRAPVGSKPFRVR